MDSPRPIFGMKLAVCLHRQSPDPGRNGSGKERMTHPICDAMKTYATTCPTYGYWLLDPQINLATAEDSASTRVKAVKRLDDDLLALVSLVDSPRPIFGMKPAVCLLHRSRDPERTTHPICDGKKVTKCILSVYQASKELTSVFSMAYEATKTHATTCSTYGYWFKCLSAYHASQKLTSLFSMAYEATKTYATTCPTYGYWPERFILGVHKRTGDLVSWIMRWQRGFSKS